MKKCKICKKRITTGSKLGYCHLCASKYRQIKYLGTFCKSNLKSLLNNSLKTFYWIGFLMADGYINFKTKRLKLTLAKKDKKHLDKFAKYIKCKIINKFKNSFSVHIQDKLKIPLIIKKWGFTKRKTYHPCSLHWLKSCSNKQFISFFIGFIDGDGCIKKQTNRDDCILSIKIHRNWKKLLNHIIHRVYKIYKIKKFNTCIRINKFVKINNQGYAITNVANNQILVGLKNFIGKYRLNVLKRKWNKIPYNFSNRYKESFYLKQRIIKLRNKGLKLKTISKILKVDKSYISTIFNQRNK
jgi:hypothetical protein